MDPHSVSGQLNRACSIVKMNNSKPETIYIEDGVVTREGTDDNCCTLFAKFIAIFWKSILTVVWPLLLLPLIIINNHEMYKCLYVIAVMGVYWVTEVLPLPITGLIPVVAYPLMGILSSTETCVCYMNDTTMMFIGSLVIAVVIENSGLHLRVALFIIKTIGCSHRRLSLGLFFVTMFISMWISNTAATAMMIPIVETVLNELEAQGLGKMFIIEEEDDKDENSETSKRPSNCTMVYYLAAAYGSSIGGIGTLVGSGTNLTLKGIFESRFPKSPGLSFTSWMMYATPAMLIMGFLTWLWLQVMYMGLFRPKSKDARAINIGKQGEQVAASVIQKRYNDLGPITWHESCVGVLFVVVVGLWFFRKPGFMRGWPGYITNLTVKDSATAIGLTILMFILPAKLDFLQAFNKDPRKRPTKPSPAMISWKIINQKMHWGLILVLGGGFAIAAGSAKSGLSAMLGQSLSSLASMNTVLMLFLICLFAETATELTTNIAVANIILPVLAEMSIAIKVHPLYLMLPAGLCCSFAFHLPVGTPPNAIVSAAGSIRTRDFIVAGIGPSIITLFITVASFATWGVTVFGLQEFPAWAE